MAAPCKFDRKCRRADCYFAHPNGREGDGGTPPPQRQPTAAAPPGPFHAPPSAAPCKFDFACTRADCYFLHPSGRAIDAANARYATPPPFVDGAGINLPDSPFGPEEAAQEEMEEMMEAQERAADKDTWYPAHRNCGCCRGFVHACVAPMCVELGVCGCTLEDEDIQAAGDAV